VEVTTTVRGIPSEVPLGRRDGLPKKCVANADNIVTIPKHWLHSRISALSREKVEALDSALRFSLGLD
jgi:mRNA interferase MazF